MLEHPEARPEAIVAGKKRPFTGAEFLESLRDGREVYIYGERVKDVTRDRRLARGVRSIAALYDLQLDPARIDQMTYRSPTTGDRVGLSHLQPRSVEDLVRRRSMMKTWAEWSAGMMVASEADDAWWPPTFRPSVLSRR